MNGMARRARQRGFTLVEIMVAMAIFVVIIAAALTMYDRSNRVFKNSLESSDMQQSTRVAFDKLVGDIRLAGYDFDRDGLPMSSLAVTWAANTAYTIGNLVQPSPPNGHSYVCIAGGTSAATPPTWLETDNAAVNENAPSTVKWQEAGSVQYQQPDEQLEYAGPRAITLRANFDYESDAAHENGREKASGYESVPFEVVTTGNDEIVTYALRSADSTKNTDSIVFYADTAIPREANPATKKTEKTVTITGVDLSGNNPPYTLVRFTLNNDGTPDAGTPIADNIRDLKFTYYTDSAAKTEIPLAKIPYGAGKYDGSKPDDVIAERDLRADIKAIKLQLVGMNEVEDRSYVDTVNYTDTDATEVAEFQHFRKYPLESVIVPRNLGRRGMREFNVDEPGKPVLKSICAGGCNAVYLVWEAPSSGGDIDSYSILYDDDGCVGGFKYSEDAGKNLDGFAGRFIEPGREWTFAVQAINKFGESTSECVPAQHTVMVLNKTKPVAPTVLKASGGVDVAYPQQANKIDVYFSPVTTNDAAACTVNCTGGGTNNQSTMPGAEKRYYRVVRGTTATFDPDSPDPAVSKTIFNELSATQPYFDGTYMKFTDAPPTNPTANCTDYYYRVMAVDYCARNKDMNESADVSKAMSAWFPAPGTNAIKGYASETATAPVAPNLLLSNSACSGGHCNLTLTWSPVSKDVGLPNGPTIFIDRYELSVERKVGTTWVAVNGMTSIPITGGATTYQLNDLLQAEEYRMYLIARDCLASDKSPYLYYPCDFGSTTVDVTVPGNFGGAGTAASPYIIQPPASVAVQASAAVSNIAVSFYDNGAEIGSGSVANPASNKATFTVPAVTEGDVILVRVTVTDSAGKCTVYFDRYIKDESPPACALTDFNTDPSVISLNSTKKGIVVKVKNKSTTETLTLQKVFVNWNIAKGEKMASADFPKADGTTVNQPINCSPPQPVGQKTSMTTKFDVPGTAATVAPGSTTYAFTLNFTFQNANKTFSSADALTSVCVQYRSSTGDQKTCALAPNAGACTEPSGGNCQ